MKLYKQKQRKEASDRTAKCHKESVVESSVTSNCVCTVDAE